jgi:hypothetical protein
MYKTKVQSTQNHRKNRASVFICIYWQRMAIQKLWIGPWHEIPDTNCINVCVNTIVVYNRCSQLSWFPSLFLLFKENYYPFLIAFAKVRKANIRFVKFVCPCICTSVRTPARRSHATTQLPLRRFSWNLVFEIFLKSVEEIQVSWKPDTNNGYLTWRPAYIYNNILLRSS